MKTLSMLVLAASACALAGCVTVSGTPMADGRFGDAVRSITAQQLLDPAAPQRNAGNVPPVDGRGVREAVDRQSDANRAPPRTTVINVGGGG